VVLAVNDVTCILSAIEQGDAHAGEQLLPLHARDKKRLKRGGERGRIDLDHVEYARLREGDRQAAD
jgi:hypothetical protein